MEEELNKAAYETTIILNNMSSEILEKIPLKVREFFEEISSNTHTFTYDTNKSLNEQNMLDKTRGIIAVLYRDYICEEDEKKEYNAIYSKYINEKELEKRELYNPDELFKKKENIKEENCCLQVVEEKTGIFKKIFYKILKFFKK